MVADLTAQVAERYERPGGAVSEVVLAGGPLEHCDGLAVNGQLDRMGGSPSLPFTVVAIPAGGQ